MPRTAPGRRYRRCPAPAAVTRPGLWRLRCPGWTWYPGCPGVALPDGGGWLAHQTAMAVSAAAALAWLRRRAAYLPGPPGRDHRGDADLAPLPATVTVVCAGLLPDPDGATEAGDGPDGAVTGGAVDPGAERAP